MAFQSGTITANPPTTYGYDLLFTELVTFLTTNADLVAANQNWVTERYDTTGGVDVDRYVYLRGPGLAGTDQIHVVIEREAERTGIQPAYNWDIRGCTDFDLELPYFQQPGTSSRCEFVLWDESIPYWFFANGRRFIVAARISNIHVNIYCGFYLPFATPSELPYPICVLASSGDVGRSYLEDDGSLSAFYNPFSDSGTSSSFAAGYVRQRQGTWTGVINGSETNNRLAHIWPWEDGDYSVGADINIAGNYDGSFPLIPTYIYISEFANSGTGAVYGELDNVFWVSGGPFNEVEDRIQVGADNYLVVSGGRRIGFNDFAAIKEE